MKTLTLAAVSSALLFAAVLPASAHITLQDKASQPGGSYRATLVVGHGCGDAATTAVRIQIPEGFYNVKPMPKAGWTLETVTGKYEKPFSNHGSVLEEGVTEISWSGGELPNAYFDEFVFRGTFGPDVSTEEPFYFPVIQTCGDAEDAWIDTSGDEEAEFPAPSVTLSPAQETGEHHH
ncbi:DUF1775 domain-containing protein [Devosia sp. PTR5]|uniref:DUF1775 domain-containing protein n=1 Tax=Devosia oryzisoli TaxID=2774138 RepID=A0A927FYV3_9HYPH|nr:DUF1775 domain-containing protein [Devosia oryzisoli]MBD8067224.1 DUF1775 domain-containing protein [Devosia oryzisoli]